MKYDPSALNPYGLSKVLDYFIKLTSIVISNKEGDNNEKIR